MMLYRELVKRQRMERAVLILKTLTRTGWVFRAAARRLGMQPQQLRQLFRRAPADSPMRAIADLYQRRKMKPGRPRKEHKK